MSTEHDLAHDAGGHDLEHAHPGPKTYTIVGVILAIITLIEVWAYNQPELRPALVPILLACRRSSSPRSSASTCTCGSITRCSWPCSASDWQSAGSVITAFMFLFGQYPQPPHG